MVVALVVKRVRTNILTLQNTVRNRKIPLVPLPERPFALSCFFNTRSYILNSEKK